MNTYVLLAAAVIIATVPNLLFRFRILGEIRQTYQLLDTLLCSMGAVEPPSSNGHHVRRPDQLAATFADSIRNKRSE